MGVGDATAEDIAQDAMLKLWAIHDSLPSGSNMAALAATVARNLAIDLMRSSHGVALPIDSLERSAADLSSSQELERQDLYQWFERKLSTLPPTEHIVLKMRQVEGRTNEEIAALVGITPDSVKTLLSRARRKLLTIIKTNRTIIS